MGRSTTTAVVTASIIVIVTDFFLAKALQIILGTPDMMTQTSIDRPEDKDADNRVSDQAAESTFREVDDSDRAIPAIEFRDVTMIFDGRKILNNLSFKVMKGETKIILGGSGCGKSTTIKLVLGLLKPDSGQILVDGEDITNYGEAEMMKVRKKIGMIFQEGALV